MTATVPAFADIRLDYTAKWQAMKIDDANRGLFDAVARRLYKNIGIYRSIERDTGVPATFIAVAHEREADGDMDAYLGNGQPLSMVTTVVPKGRGPFGSFSEGAIDALRYEGLDKIKDWSLERMLYCLEAYNGWGYRLYHNMPSPYLWSRTTIAQRGKYVADGKFDPTIMDVQVGCAGIISSLWTIDPTLRPEATSDVVVPAAPFVGTFAARRRLQADLNELGADPRLETDGVIGPATKAALRALADQP